MNRRVPIKTVDSAARGCNKSDRHFWNQGAESYNDLSMDIIVRRGGKSEGLAQQGNEGTRSIASMNARELLANSSTPRVFEFFMIWVIWVVWERSSG